jgi:hypothetical protein
VIGEKGEDLAGLLIIVKSLRPFSADLQVRSFSADRF